MNAFTRTPEGDEGGPTRPNGRIGPNAITRMIEALRALEGDDECEAIFASARLARYLAEAPGEMVSESEVSDLHRATFLHLGPQRAARVSREAGRLTGDYLLANRIPAAAQKVLRVLPRGIAARVLLAAVSRHAWTFAGSGAFSYGFAPQLTLRIEGSPICLRLRTDEKVCHYFAATFEHLFRALVAPQTRVEETECEAGGAAACVFRVDY